MRTLYLTVLLHSVILLPFAVTATVLISFGQHGAAAIFSLIPALIVAGIWWLASLPQLSAEIEILARQGRDDRGAVFEDVYDG